MPHFNLRSIVSAILFGSLTLTFGGGCDQKAISLTPPQTKSSTNTSPISRSGPLGVGIDRSIKTPLTARGRCLDLIIDCHSTTDEEQDQCVNHLRRCQTDQPWNENEACCPSACINDYLHERQNGTNSLKAVDATFGPNECYPGVEQMIRGESWE